MDQRRLALLNSLRAFESFGRLGRMTLAASELTVTHAAISRKVRQLEGALGVKLFIGPKNHLALTDAGRALISQLTPAFGQIEAAVGGIVDDVAGTLNVSCLATFMMRWLIPRQRHFDSKYASIDVRLSASDNTISFEREHYDIAIRLNDRKLPEDVYVTKLFLEQVGPVLSPALVERMDIYRPEDLDRIPLLRTKTRPHAWPAWAYQLRKPAPGQAAKSFEHFYFALEAAAAGLGACIAPWPLVIDDLSAGRLVAPFGFVPSGLSYVALRKRNRNRKAEDFCEWLEKEAKNTPTPP